MKVVSFTRRADVLGNSDVLQGAGALFQGTTTRVVGTAEAAAGSKKKEHLRRRFYIIRKNAESSFGIDVDHYCKCIIGYHDPEQSERFFWLGTHITINKLRESDWSSLNTRGLKNHVMGLNAVIMSSYDMTTPP